MKKYLMMICALMLCIALLAGCGAAPAKEAEETVEATVEAAPEETEEEAAPEETEEEAAPEATEEAAEEETEEPDVVEEVPQDTPSEESVKISPLPETIDVSALTDCTVAISLQEGGVSADAAGGISMTATVYTYYLYDMVDIAAMKEGDIITLSTGDVTIEDLARGEDGTVYINGGLDVGGYELATDESGVYYEEGYSDAKSYNALGEVTLPIADNFTLTDASDLDNEPVIYEVADLMDGTAAYHFVPHNTKIIVSGGSVVAMEVVYTP